MTTFQGNTPAGSPFTITHLDDGHFELTIQSASHGPLVGHLGFSGPIRKPDGDASHYVNICTKTDQVHPIALTETEHARLAKWRRLRVEAHSRERLAAHRAQESPAERALREVRGLEVAAERAETATSYDPAIIVQARLRASRARDEWRKEFPDDARELDATRLREDAADLRAAAEEALGYTADGWLDDTQRQRRHDELVARAEDLERQADV